MGVSAERGSVSVTFLVRHLTLSYLIGSIGHSGLIPRSLRYQFLYRQLPSAKAAGPQVFQFLNNVRHI